MHRFKTPPNASLNDALNKLRDVMLYDTTVSALATPQAAPVPTPQAAPVSTPQAAPVPTPQAAPVPNDTRFRPALNQDPLYWCLYIMMHGAFKYDQLANRFTAEQDGKRDQVLLLRERAKQLKQSTGIKFSASSIESDIMSPRISLHAFQVLVRLNSLNAVFMNPANRVYAEFISDAVSDKPVHVIERNDKNSKCMTMTQTNGPFSTSYYRIENPLKPIKSASSYTVAELTELCHQLKIQLKPKMKKQELYDAVSSQLVL